VSLRVKPPPIPEDECTLPLASDSPPVNGWSLSTRAWSPDWEGKATDMGFAYVSMWLKSRVEGLASIPELTKDSLDFRKKLGDNIDEFMKKQFGVMVKATNPNADLGRMADESWSSFQTSAAKMDSSVRNAVQNNLSTTAPVPEGSSAGAGIETGRVLLQDNEDSVNFIGRWFGAAEAPGSP
jgi:hypothetical protein